MSRKHFSFLLALTLAVALVVLLMPGKTGKESGFEPSLLLPGLQEQVNDLDLLQFTGAGDAAIATLRRSEGRWRVEEADGYRADWERLRTLLADLARAEVVEPKTANPDYYDRLGVEDVSLPDAGGLQIGFPESSGLPAVIVGNRAQGRGGQYVRLAGAGESALIDRELDVPSSASEWLERDIVDISDSEVVEVEIVHADGERIVATKASADDTDFELQDIPEGREIRSAWTVNSLANSLAALTLDGVAEEGEVDWAEATRFGLLTAGGLRVDVELATVTAPESAKAETGESADETEAEYWIRLQANVHQAATAILDEEAAEVAEEPEADRIGDQAAVQAEEEPAEPPADETTSDDPAGRAQSINDRVSGWAYRIPQYKFDAMNKRMEDLLLAVDEAED